MALNALRTEMVTFTGTPGIEVNGVVIGYKAEYTKRTSPEAKYNAIAGLTTTILADNGQYFVQLGEQLYDGDLRLANSTDAFGRPSRYWEYDGKEIGTYMKKEILSKEWYVEVTGKDLYDELGKSTIEDNSYDFFIYVDGEDRYNATDGTSGVSTVFNRTQMNKNNKAGVGGTGDGTLTQLFVDSNSHEVTVAVINTYLARAKADYNEKRDEVSFDVYAIDKGTANGTDYYWKNLDRDNDQKETMIVSGEDFDVANVQEKDTFLVTVAEGEIQTMAVPEVISAATLDSFKRNDNVVAEGTTYKYTTTAQYDVEVLDDYTGDSSYGVNLKDKHYNIYLDKYNNLIGIDLVEDADNYVFITGVDSKTSNLSAKQYDANAIFLDGTMKTITFDNEKSSIDLSGDNALLNTWCTYTVSGSSELYTLKEISKPATTAATVDGKSVGVGDSYVGLKNGTSKAIKVGQYRDLMNGVDANASAGNEIDVKHVSLRGSVGASRNDYKYVYGNDATVYLNVEVKGIYTGAGNTAKRGVVSKVSSVTTGIKSASLEVMTGTDAQAQAKRKSASSSVTPDVADTAYGAYVLYNDKGYVIAAITVADDSAASENLVYVNSGSVSKESYNSTADEWTWQREVIQNGDKVTLTEVGDSISILKNLKQHNWYVISYNADGEVISANHALDELASKTATKHCDVISNLESVINGAGVNTVLYEKSSYNGLTAANPNGCPDNNKDPHTPNAYYNATGPKLENNTFYDITTATTGFYVNDDVKVVFIQKVKNVWETELKEGKTDLENVIDALNKAADGLYDYEVSAILNAGRADVVVIRDLNAHGDGGSYVQGGNKKITFSPVQYKLSDYEFWVNDAQLKEEDFTKVNAREWYFTVDDTDIITIVEKNGTKFDVVGDDYLLDDNGTVTTTDDIKGDVVEKGVLEFTTNRNMTLPNSLTDAPDTPAGIPEAVPGVKVAIKGADASATDLAVGYFGVDMPSIDQALQAVKNWILTGGVANAKTIDVSVSGDDYTFTVKNALGVTVKTLALAVDDDVVEGVRVQYVNADGTAAASGYEIVEDVANTSKYVDDVLYIKQNGKYTKAQAPAATAWTWSEKVGVNDDDFSTAAKKQECVAINGHDWKVNLSDATKSIKIDTDTYYNETGTGANVVAATNGFLTQAQFDAKYEGTMLKKSDTVYVPVGASATDGDTYLSGYVKLNKITGEVTNVKVDGVEAVEAKQADGSTADTGYVAVPVNEDVELTIAKAAKFYTVTDADGKLTVADVIDANAGSGAAVVTITTNAKDVTVAEVSKITLKAAVKNNADADAMRVTWEYNGKPVSGDIYIPTTGSTENIKATLEFLKPYADSDVANSKFDEFAGSAGATADCLSADGTATTVKVAVKGATTAAGTKYYYTWTETEATAAGTLEITLTVVSN